MILDLVRKLLRWNRARNRRLDQEYLWPQLRRNAPIVHARIAFLNHAFSDPAWTTDLTNEQIANIVDCLE